MKEITFSTLKSKINYYFDSVLNSSEILIVPNANNDIDDAVVIMPLSEYNSLQETNYLISTEANRNKLKESIQQSKSGKVKEVNIDDY